MLTENEVRSLAESAFLAALGASVFERAEIEAHLDHDGEDALFVTAHFRSGVDSVRPETVTDALVSLRRSLQERGDERFPYVRYDFPDDERPIAEEVGAPAE
jgi:hypothetical protein